MLPDRRRREPPREPRRASLTDAPSGPPPRARDLAKAHGDHVVLDGVSPDVAPGAAPGGLVAAGLEPAQVERGLAQTAELLDGASAA